MSRLLFWFTIALAASLVLLVLLTPLTIDRPTGVLALFAADPVVRRTALASAVGLSVTACVFFRATATGKASASADGLPPRTPVIGA